MKSVNPATGAFLNEYPDHDRDDVNRVLDAASDAWEAWGFGPLEARAQLMSRVADLLDQRRDKLARLATMEMGKPVRQARAEVEKCAWACRHYAENAADYLAPREVSTDAARSYVTAEPIGVVYGIMPWNFPFWQVFRACVPAMMTGNAFVLKHAENVPGCALACHELFDDAGAPEGVFQTLLITKELAEPIISDDRVQGVTLTGSTGAGRIIAAQAGAALNPVVLELGGSDPFVVLADADLARAADTAVQSRFQNNGQSCIAAKRIIVEAPVYDRFVRMLTERVEALEVDDPLFESTDVGPLAREDLLENLAGQVDGSKFRGARLIVGGKRIGERGWFYAPTLLAEVEPGMPAFDEETFGPVASVTMADDTDHAIELANNSQFGLGSNVWTSPERGTELAPRFRAGYVAVNGMTKSDPRLPFGGVRASGMGRELSVEGQLAFANIKTVWIGE